MNEEQAIREFLGDRPSAAQLADWRTTLEQRLQALVEERQRIGATASLDTRVSQLQRQIAALSEEEAVTRFVEDSVRVTLAMGAGTDGMDKFEE